MMPDYTDLLSRNSVHQRSEHKEIYPGNDVLSFTSILGVPSACTVAFGVKRHWEILHSSYRTGLEWRREACFSGCVSSYW